ncbi:V-type ATPase, G subunit [Pneumocystis jirovecii RU7]|uniref:V-type proton ATPase subunit G n=1 Tax=Pneumocystis jirovecii (strain RU7) TaxID=1408657 RepID=A0A0W4ZUX9_PNEJ7|nr:V-type ATPase, G subunit [Pneumocystis jirovecii RU7]KTW32183.1 V-type ATPase, G subunit [Pneumocystis jirovecii RU7]
MSVQSSSGIQTLLEVEKESQKIVEKARECRAQGLKNARLEAQAVIEEYRLQKEDAFETYKKELTGSNIKQEEIFDKMVEEKLEKIRQQAASAKEETVKKITELLTTVDLKMYTNIDSEILRDQSIENNI